MVFSYCSKAIVDVYVFLRLLQIKKGIKKHFGLSTRKSSLFTNIFLSRSITMYDISMAMIQVTSFHEVLSMQTATVCAIWGAIKHCFDSSWLVLIFEYEGRAY